MSLGGQRSRRGCRGSPRTPAWIQTPAPPHAPHGTQNRESDPPFQPPIPHLYVQVTAGLPPGHGVTQVAAREHKDGVWHLLSDGGGHVPLSPRNQHEAWRRVRSERLCHWTDRRGVNGCTDARANLGITVRLSGVTGVVSRRSLQRDMQFVGFVLSPGQGNPSTVNTLKSRYLAPNHWPAV